MKYSTKPKYRKYVKGYVFLSFAGKLDDKYGKKLINIAKTTGIDVAKTASKRKDQFKRLQKWLEIWLEIKELIKLLQ